MEFAYKMTPAFRHGVMTPWGGSKLKTLYGKEIPDGMTGESLEASTLPGLESRLPDGRTLTELCGGPLPLLLKFISARERLSVQVHPTDEYALRDYNSYGKTEMWYIVDAEKNASLVLGFNQEIDKATYFQALHQNKLMDLLNVQKVKKGESFFIPAGLVHAIGKGCLIAEIQQTSDITYRIYDYNRKDANGNTRELHTDLATDVIDYSYQPQHRVNYTPQNNQSTRLVKCPYFTTNLLVFDRDIEKEYVHLDSFVIYMCLQGKFTITTGECEPVLVNKGETVLIPACFKNLTLYPDDITQILEIYVEE